MEGVAGAGFQVGPEDSLFNVISGDTDSQTTLVESFSFVFFVLKKYLKNVWQAVNAETKSEVSASLQKRGGGIIEKIWEHF